MFAILALQRIRQFRRHVVFIVLGEYLIGDEHAVLHAAGSDDALPLLEQVGQDAFITHRQRLHAIGKREIDLQAISALDAAGRDERSEEHTSELQSLLRSSYAVFCLKK